MPAPLGPISAVIEPSLDVERRAVDGAQAAEALDHALGLEDRRRRRGVGSLARTISSFLPNRPWGRNAMSRIRIRPTIAKRSARLLRPSREESRKRVPRAPSRGSPSRRHAEVAGEAAEDQDRVAEEGEERLESVGVDDRRFRARKSRRRRRGRPRSRATAACRRTRSCRARAPRPRPRGSRAARAPTACCAEAAARGEDQHRDQHDDEQRQRRELLAEPEVAQPRSWKYRIEDLHPVLVEARGAPNPGSRPSGHAPVLRPVMDHLGEGDRHDREVVLAQSQRRQADVTPTKQIAASARDREREPETRSPSRRAPGWPSSRRGSP